MNNEVVNPITYRILLNLTGPYFFGDEARSTFGNKEPYFRHSLTLPSQPTLLGLVRRTLCLQEGISTWSEERIRQDNLERAGRLIGNGSFDPEIIAYGWIRYISPGALIFKNQRYYPSYYRMRGYNSLDLKPLQLRRERTQGFLELDHFNAKEEFIPSFYNPALDSFVPESSMVTREVMTRIQKSSIGKGEVKGFFKDECIRYTQGVSLEFFVQLELDGKLESNYALLGGDRRVCAAKISKQKLPDEYQESNQPAMGSEGWLLISDSFIRTDYKKRCEFAWGQTRQLRYRKTRVDDKTFVERTFSPLTTVMNAGAVLIPKKDTQPEDIFLHPNARKVGFNHFIKINMLV